MNEAEKIHGKRCALAHGILASGLSGSVSHPRRFLFGRLSPGTTQMMSKIDKLTKRVLVPLLSVVGLAICSMLPSFPTVAAHVKLRQSLNHAIQLLRAISPGEGKQNQLQGS